MRFIVEIYRLIILAFLALALIAASFVVVKVIQNPELASGNSAYVMIAVFTAAVFVILSVGITATFISMHDRLETIAECAESVVALEQERAALESPLETDDE